MTPDREKLRQLAESVALPWAYRPYEHDDWGYIRGPEKVSELIGPYKPVVANSRQSDVSEEQMTEHRAAKTDPYEPAGRLIVAAVNALPSLLDEIDRLRADLAEAREALEAYREALTPSGDTKAAYIGEFHMGINLRLRGEEDYRRVQIPWDTIKEIMKAISARAASALSKLEGVFNA